MIKLRLFQVALLLLAWPQLAASQKDYFQQEVNYTIAVTLDDKNHQLTGNEEVEYINHSPDTLRVLYFHLWPNAYRDNHTALAKQLVRNGNKRFQYAHDTSRGWIADLDFKQEGTAVKWEYDEKHADICMLTLNTPILPGQRTVISTPFKVQIPGDFSRLGHVERSYQISQWYPKPAVYDRDGWHAMPYLDQGEFYSEFGRFEVSITLDALYRVAATGILQEEEEKQWLNSLANYLNIQKPGERVPPDEVRFGKTKTITFIQDNIHDFAFFCAKDYVVRKDEATLKSGRKVAVWAFFEPKEDSYWKKATDYLKRAVVHYSHAVGEYPYDAATAVQGALSAGGGMEYPMVTVISAGWSPQSLDEVITHEIGHNWFYGILASNERQHAWMDEGFNSYVENRYMEANYPDRHKGSAGGFGFFPGLTEDDEEHWADYLTANIFSTYMLHEPVGTPSMEMAHLHYGSLAYARTAFLLNYLSQYLGQSLFDSCMQTYFSEWKFRHPRPEDVREVFERVSGKDLSWFFGELIQTNQLMDYAMKGLDVEDGYFVIKVKNKGRVNAPYSISLIKAGKVISTHWFDGHEGIREQKIKWKDCDVLVLDKTYESPDINLRNNSLKATGLFKKSEPMKAGFVTSLTRNDQVRVNLLPAIAVNTRDLLMLGMAFHNFDLQGKRFNYYLMPLYSLGDKTLAGTAILKYDWPVFNKSLYKIRLQAQHARYAAFDKAEPSLAFYFKTGRVNHVKHALTLSHALIWHRYFAQGSYTDYQSTRVRYSLKRKNALVEQQLDFSAMVSEYSRIDLSYRRQMNFRKSKLISRLYLGYTPDNTDSYFALYTSGSPDVNKDQYLVDRVGNRRFGWLGTNQRLADQGGFKTANFAANGFMSTLNLEFRPGKFFIYPFVNGLVCDPMLNSFTSGYRFFYEGGLGVNLGILNVYVPVFSNYYSNYLPDSGKVLGNAITFSLSSDFGSLLNKIEEF